jgi:hypothetical protein
MTTRIEPVKRPPTPAPAIALPMIKVLLVGATAQTKELIIDK